MPYEITFSIPNIDIHTKPPEHQQSSAAQLPGFKAVCVIAGLNIHHAEEWPNRNAQVLNFTTENYEGNEIISNVRVRK